MDEQISRTIQPTQQEVKEKLHQLNLTTAAKERNTLYEWFSTRHIELFFVGLTAFLVPLGITKLDIETHIEDATRCLKALDEALSWFEERSIHLRIQRIQIDTHTTSRIYVPKDAS